VKNKMPHENHNERVRQSCGCVDGKIKIAVKYCGGCNPRFNRLDFVANLFDSFPQLEFSKADTDEPCMALTICGCQCACADFSYAQNVAKKILICDESEFETLCEQLNSLLSKQ